MLPNPSGLNIGFSLDQLVDAYRDMRYALADDKRPEPLAIPDGVPAVTDARLS